MRSEFQNYLSKNFTEESLKFWEYAEDYRRGHPLSLQPFLDLNAVKVMDKHAKNKKLGVSMGNSYGGGSGADIAAIQHAIMNPNITTEPSDTDVNKMASKVLTESERKMANEWARMIYNTYIDDGAPMQIGDCSSDMKEEIAAALTKGDVDAGLYFNIQIKIFHNMKYKQFLEFVLQPGYRKFLMSSLLHKNCVVSTTQLFYSIIFSSELQPRIFIYSNFHLSSFTCSVLLLASLGLTFLHSLLICLCLKCRQQWPLRPIRSLCPPPGGCSSRYE